MKNLFDKAKKAVADKTGEIYESVSEFDLKTVGKDKLKSLAEEFNKAVPILREAGYEISEAGFEIGISPKIIAHLLRIRNIDEEKKQELKEKHKANRMISGLLSGLFKAETLQSSLKLDEFTFREIEAEIGLMPAVKIKYRNLRYEQILRLQNG